MPAVAAPLAAYVPAVRSLAAVHSPIGRDAVSRVVKVIGCYVACTPPVEVELVVEVR